MRVTQAVNRWADRKYPPAITWALDRPGQVIGGAVALFVLTLVLIVPRLGTELIPQMSQGEFNVDLRLPAGTLEATDRAVVAAQLASAGSATSTRLPVAGTGNRLDANPVDAGENTGRLSITLARGSGRAEEEAAMAGMRRSLEGLPACSTSSAARACSRCRHRSRSSSRATTSSGCVTPPSRCGSRCRPTRASPTSSRRSRPATPRSRSFSTRSAQPSSGSGRARHRRSRRTACAARSPRATRWSTRRSTCWCAASTLAPPRSRKSAT